MSQQSENKATQGYETQGPSCGNCAHFTFESVDKTVPGYPTWIVKSKLRCAIGDFKVSPRGWCSWHLLKKSEHQP